jgi:hypothetical protein
MPTNRELHRLFPNGFMLTSGRGRVMAICPVSGGPFTYVTDAVDAHAQAAAKGGRLITEDEMREVCDG